jgi:HIT zinc finger
MGRRCEVDDCKVASQYECPKCAIAFCSVTCYQKHSVDCVSAFRAAATENELRGIWASDEEQSRMREVLTKFREFDSYNRTDSPTSLSSGFSPPVSRSRSSEVSDCQTQEHDRISHPCFPASRLERGPVEDESESEEDNRSSDDDDSGGNFEDLEDALDRIDDEQEGEAGGAEIGDQDPRDSDDPDIAETLEELLTDMKSGQVSAEEALDRLPAELARDFKERVADGRIGRSLPQWQPWWLREVDPDTECGKNGDDDSEEDGGDDYLSKIPCEPCTEDYIVSPAAAYARASPAILYSLVDVLGSYCVSMRLCCGDWCSSPGATATSMFQRSLVLGEDARHGSVSAAAGGFTIHCGRPATLAREGLADAAAVLRLGGGATRALFDAWALLREAQNSGVAAATARKVGFLAAWCAAAPPVNLQVASTELDAWLGAEAAWHAAME